jgi:hypothetical protein
MKKNAAIFLIGIWRIPFGVQMMYFYVFYFSGIGPSAKSLHQYARHARHAAKMYMVPAFYTFYGVIGGNEFDIL